LPEGIHVQKESGMISFKGPKGELAIPILPFLKIAVNASSIQVSPHTTMKQSRANAGTMWSLINNAVEGITLGFSKTLQIEGIGYRANMEANSLMLSLGYVQPVKFDLPEGISVSLDKNLIKLAGIDKHLLGETAARIRQLKKPEPYKGKGIRYQGEIVRRKVGKKAAAAA